MISTVTSDFTGTLIISYRGETEIGDPQEIREQVFVTEPRPTIPPVTERIPGETDEAFEERKAERLEEIRTHQEKDLDLREQKPILQNRACQDIFFKQSLTITTGFNQESSSLRLFDGHLLSCVITTDTEIPIGGLFVEVQILSGSTKINSVILHTLISGVVAKTRSLSWPENQSTLNIATEQYVIGKLFLDQNPGFNMNIGLTGLMNTTLLVVQFLFDTSSTTSTRRVELTIETNGGTIFFRRDSAFTQVANTTKTYTFTAAGDNSNTSKQIFEMLPVNFRLPPNSRIRTSITNLKSGDRITDQVITMSRITSGITTP